MNYFRCYLPLFFLCTPHRVCSRMGSSLLHFSFQIFPHTLFGERSGLRSPCPLLLEPLLVMFAKCGFKLSFPTNVWKSTDFGFRTLTLEVFFSPSSLKKIVVYSKKSQDRNVSFPISTAGSSVLREVDVTVNLG